MEGINYVFWDRTERSGSKYRPFLRNGRSTNHGYVLLKWPAMWRPSDGQWWALVAVALVIVLAWPPASGKSLAMKIVNWAVDPSGALPILPPQLGPGSSDDVAAVDEHDAVVRQYDAVYLQGGWTRRRLLLKVADDPFDKSTTRQVLSALGVLGALVTWRLAARRVH